MRIRKLLFSSLTFPRKTNLFKSFLLITFWRYLYIIFKDKKKSQSSRNQGFSYFFCLVIEGSRSGSGSESMPLTDGSGSGSRRPKNMWIRWIRIRIRIRNTDCNKMYTIFLKIILSSYPWVRPWSLFWFRATYFFFIKRLITYQWPIQDVPLSDWSNLARLSL
jgi:hypothetical protein